MRDVARLGFVLLGLQLVFSAIQGSAAIISELTESIDGIGFGVISIFVFAVLVFIPGCFLVARNRMLASYLFSDQDRTPSQYDLVAAGLAVVGAYLVIVGVSGALSFTVIAAMTSTLDVPGLTAGHIRSVIWYACQIGFGFVIFRYPQPILRRLG